MNFNILRNAIIRNSSACRFDNKAGFAVEWVENDDFEQYNEVSGVAARLVWDRNYMAVATSGICYIGPDTDQAAFNASIYDRVHVVLRLEQGLAEVVPTTARLQFQTGADPVYDGDKAVDFSITVDNTYNEYIVDMSQVREWAGDIIRLRIYPIVDGSPGIVIHLKSIRVYSSSGGESHVCSIGAGGSCEGSYVADGIDIVTGVNDKLLININEYGNQGATLNPVSGARLQDIARDIEEKLSNIAIGGYSGSQADVSFGKLKITADTREAVSTVVVADTPAARTLGFYDANGINTSTYLVGEEASEHYAPVGTIQLGRAEIARLYVPDPAVGEGITFRPRGFAVQAGRADFAGTYKDKKLDFGSKTVIDFNNPVSNNGTIVNVAYSGDGSSTTEFRFFRPKADGTIVHFSSVAMGISGSQIGKVFEKTCSVKVRKGDFVGIYNGKLDLGKTEEVPNVSYFLYAGNLTGGATAGPLPIAGRGETGLRLFARGSDYATEAVLDISFEEEQLIEEVIVYATEESRVEEINLSRVRAGGIGGGPYIEGETGLDKYGAQAPPLTSLGSLTDGIKYSVVGATSLYPSWLDSVVTPADKYDQTSFSVTLDFARGIPVFFNINRVVLYFRDVQNVKYFSVQYPWTTNVEDTDRYFGSVADSYNEVYMSDRLLEPKDHTLYNNPNNPVASEFEDSYQFLEYRKLDLRFDSVRARTIKYIAKNFNFDDDPLSETLSDFTVAPSPYILELEVFAESLPDTSIVDNFFFESSQDGEKYVSHTNSSSAGSTSASYLIGYPIKHLRAYIRPQGEMCLGGFLPTLTRAQTAVRTSGGDNFVALTAAKNDHVSYETVQVINDGSTTFNYYVTIGAQKNPVERCILWNKLGSASELAVSEIGSSPTTVKRSPYYLREYNYSLNMPAYTADPFWLRNRNATVYISYDHGATWECRGLMVTDYNVDTYLTSESLLVGEYLNVYILVDLGARYALQSLEAIRPAGAVAFTGPAYSNIDTADPAALNLSEDFGGSMSDVRWLRFNSFSREVGYASKAVLSYVRASLSVTNNLNANKVLWLPAPKLVDYVFGRSDGDVSNDLWQQRTGTGTSFVSWYAIDLEDFRNITNILIGPCTDYIGYAADLDLLSPGGVASAYSSSSKTNSSIAYSASDTDNVNRVRWGSFGAAPTGRDRWILLKRTALIWDEVVVHIDDNVQEDKPSFGSARWWSAQLGEVTRDDFNFVEGNHSISVTYAVALGPEEEELELEQSFGIDADLAPRDMLRILFYVSDASQLDFSKGYFSIGRYTTEVHTGRAPLVGKEKDEYNYFIWPFSDLEEFISTGWNELYLPFTANYRVGRPNFEKDDVLSLVTYKASGRSRFRWFRVNFAGVGSNKAFTVNVDGIKIVRGDFLPSRWGNGYYLAKSDYARFPLHNFNPLEGTIEFYINADWAKNYWCQSCDDPHDHTIFRFFNSDGYVLAAFMTGNGLIIYLSDGEKHFTLTDNGAGFLNVGQDHHFAVVWDLKAAAASPALAVYIDNKLSSTFEAEALFAGDFKTNPNATLLLGGNAWGGITSFLVSSVDGIIDNLKVFNYAINDFSYSMENEGVRSPRPGDELIEISLDGVNFYGSETRGDALPLLARNISPGGTFNIYVRSRACLEDIASEGQERVSYLEIKKARSG